MRTVSEILADLGGDANVAREIGAPLTTVNSWKRKDYVPSWRIPLLLQMAVKVSKPLSTADFPEKRAA